MAEPNNEFKQRVVAQFWAMVAPEIERRQQAGSLPQPVDLNRIQIIFHTDGRQQFRLNDEVQAVSHARIRPGMAEGDDVTVSDLEAIDAIELTEADPNEGHITAIAYRDGWAVRFDFRYNASLARSKMEVAHQFLDTARHALSQTSVRAFLYNLYTAVELIATTELLLHADQQLMKATKHGVVTAQYNRWGKLGNVAQQEVQLLNRLANVRTKAVYRTEVPRVSGADAQAMLPIAETMYRRVLGLIPPLHPAVQRASEEVASDTNPADQQ